MDSSIENTLARGSGLRAPTRWNVSAAPATGLQEITESQSNARAQPSTMLPPQGTKRALNGNLTQPEPKRKTLVERAGEPTPKPSSLPSIGIPVPTSSRAPIKGISISSLAATNIKPTPAQNALSRQTSNSSTATRPPSTNSFATSLGPGSRPPVSNYGRAPTSMGFNQSMGGRQRGNTRSRPATAMGDRGADMDGGPAQPNGTKHSLLFQTSNKTTRCKRVRGTVSMQPLASHAQQDKNDFSAMERGFSALSLRNDEEVGKPKGGQASSKQDTQVPLHSSQLDVKIEHVTSRQSQGEEAARLSQFRPADSLFQPLSWPETPSRTDVDTRVAIDQFEKVFTASKTAVSPSKSCSPVKTQPFLTKDSNVKAFTGWDVDERLHEVESQFKVMKEAMDVSLTDKKTLEDAVNLAKTRVTDLERERYRLDEKNEQLRTELSIAREESHSLRLTLEAQQRNHNPGSIGKTLPGRVGRGAVTKI
ncbi:hypothetical protein B0H66DRAFT_152217 [Apodospora peruviana]|uniref:Uncharacterized protein n=1 Tax=Apodospora peruviana TaxID=516989 RepID=A0AAE0MB88_9PEZI|nr:hypothetical protein B0H66DRAFT_152217 [Apodospora peruviana]